MTKADAQASALTRMADELGDLERELAPIKAKISRAEALRKALRASYAKSDPMQAFELAGERWRLLVGPAGNKSRVDMRALFQLVNTSDLLPHVQVSLTALEENFGADVLGAVVTLVPGGTRELQFIPVMNSPKAPGKRAKTLPGAGDLVPNVVQGVQNGVGKRGGKRGAHSNQGVG